MSADSYLSTSEAARRIGVSAKTVGRWVDAGFLPAVFTAGGHRRIRELDLNSFLQSRRSLMTFDSRDVSIRVLVVSGDPDLLREIRSAAGVVGIEEVEAQAELMAAAIALGAQQPDLLIVDLEANSGDLLAAAERDPHTQRVYRVAVLPPGARREYASFAHRVLSAPCNPAELVSTFHDAVEHRDRVNSR